MRKKNDFIFTAGAVTVCSLLIEGVTLPDSHALTALEPAYPAIKAAVANGDCNLASLQNKPIVYNGARDAFRLNHQQGAAVLNLDGVQVDPKTDTVFYRFNLRDQATGDEYSNNPAEVRSHLCTSVISAMLNRKLAN